LCVALLTLCNFKLRRFQIHPNFESYKMEIVTIFKLAPNFPVAGIKSVMKKSGGRILLGDNTGGVVIVMRSMGFRCVEIGISSRLPFVCVCVCVCVYIYIYICIMNTKFRLAQNAVYSERRNVNIGTSGSRCTRSFRRTAVIYLELDDNTVFGPSFKILLFTNHFDSARSGKLI
jgi:hypothetical protein